ncbi:hypothetical protein U1Q18_010906, partial [Sarracenia purpurea var. burkii]
MEGEQVGGFPARISSVEVLRLSESCATPAPSLRTDISIQTLNHSGCQSRVLYEQSNWVTGPNRIGDKASELSDLAKVESSAIPIMYPTAEPVATAQQSHDPDGG